MQSREDNVKTPLESKLENINGRTWRQSLLIWRKWISFSFISRRWQYIVIALLGISNALVEGLMPLITKSLVDALSGAQDVRPLWHYILAYVPLAMLSITFIWIAVLKGSQLSLGLLKEFRQKCFDHCQKMSLSFYDNRQIGWLIAHVTSDCSVLSQALAWSVLDLLFSLPALLFTFSFLFYLHWPLALWVMVLFPLMILMTVLLSLNIVKSARQERQYNARLIAVYNESIAGVMTTRSLARESLSQKEFEDDTLEYFRRCMRRLMFSVLLLPGLTLLIYFGTGMAIWKGGEYVVLQQMTLGTLIAFISYTQFLSYPISTFSRIMVKIQTATPAAERVMELLETPPGVPDKPSIHALTEKAALYPINKIRLENLSFCYQPEGDRILKNIELDIRVGETIALVGATGSGKSTLVNVLCRFYEPSVGRVLINGIDYRELSQEAYQSQITMVLQSPLLFSGTIESNIRYGCLEATDEEIQDVAKKVHLHDIVMNMDLGYKSHVEEGGRNLSTGQKQLISFARAIIAKPQVMIMDEATSAVDTQTERLLQEGIEATLKGRTSIIIAHRLSTIKNADRIVYMDKGRIVEIGSHENLLKRKGRYYHLYQQQFVGEQ